MVVVMMVVITVAWEGPLDRRRWCGGSGGSGTCEDSDQFFDRIGGSEARENPTDHLWVCSMRVVFPTLFLF